MMKAFSIETRGLVLAVLIGLLSIFPAMLIGIIILYSVLPSRPPDLIEQFQGWFMIAFVGLIYSYGFTLIYGAPIFLLLKKLNKNSLFYVVLASLIPAIVLSISKPENWIIYLAMGYFSLCVGVSCWLLVNRIIKKSANKNFNKNGPDVAPIK